MAVVGIIVNLAPIAAFAAMAFIVGSYGRRAASGACVG